MRSPLAGASAVRCDVGAPTISSDRTYDHMRAAPATLLPHGAVAIAPSPSSATHDTVMNEVPAGSRRNTLSEWPRFTASVKHAADRQQQVDSVYDQMRATSPPSERIGKDGDFVEIAPRQRRNTVWGMVVPAAKQAPTPFLDLDQVFSYLDHPTALENRSTSVTSL